MSPTTTFFDKLVAKLTTRDLMQALKVSYVTLKDRAKDPSKLSLEQIIRLAQVLEISAEQVLTLVVEEIRTNPSPGADLLAAQGVVTPVSEDAAE